MSDSSTSGLVVSGLKASWGSARALQDVTLRVAPGEVVALVGPNGAGKTTTLRAISGDGPNVSGDVTLDGAHTARNPRTMARLGVVHVPEGRGLIGSMSVRDNLRLGCIAGGSDLTQSALREVTDIFPIIASKIGARAGQLSGGEQQMVAVARGLLSKPTILMVDELSLGLAPLIVQQILETLADAARNTGLGLLLVDQNVTELAQVATRLYMLRHGRSEEITNMSAAAISTEVYLGE